MKKLYTFAFLLALSLLFAASMTSGVRAGKGAEGSPVAVDIGSVVTDFKLPDVDGRERSLSSLKGKNGTALIFISVQCPVSNAYNERMEKLAEDYKARGINVIGINANSTESAADVKAHAASHNLTFTILKDVGNKIADMLGAEHTPEAYLLDASNKLVYRGRIDNAKDETRATTKDLRAAMDAVLADKPVTKVVAPAFGCSIKRV